MLSIFGLVAIFVFTYNAYKISKQFGRHSVGWAAIVFGVGFGVQIVVPFFIGIAISIVMFAGGSTGVEVQEAIYTPAMLIGAVCILVSVVAMFLILRYLGKVPEYDENVSLPPPPTDFEIN